MAIETLTPAQVEQLARGERQLRVGRKPFPTKLTPSEREVFERAKERGYLVHRQSNNKLAMLWRCWCDATVQPHVAVKVRRQYAEVELELPEAGSRLTDEGLQAAIQAMRRASKRIRYGYGPTSASHPSVPIPNAEPLAVEFLRIAREHITKSPRLLP